MAELGREAGVTRQAVYGWVNQGKTPAYEALERLKSRHRINDEWVLKGVGPMLLEKRDSLDAELANILRSFQDHPDPEVRRRFLKIARAFLDE
jgi:hypothetical protein